MYLTRRQNGFRFQRRIPKNLEPILGKSPIRIHMGNLPARDASRIARLLAGHSDLLFQELELKGYRALSDKSDTTDDIDPRDATIARSLIRCHISPIPGIILIKDTYKSKFKSSTKRVKSFVTTILI